MSVSVNFTEAIESALLRLGCDGADVELVNHALSNGLIEYSLVDRTILGDEALALLGVDDFLTGVLAASLHSESVRTNSRDIDVYFSFRI